MEGPNNVWDLQHHTSSQWDEWVHVVGRFWASSTEHEIHLRLEETQHVAKNKDHDRSSPWPYRRRGGLGKWVLTVYFPPLYLYSSYKFSLLRHSFRESSETLNWIVKGGASLLKMTKMSSFQMQVIWSSLKLECTWTSVFTQLQQPQAPAERCWSYKGGSFSFFLELQDFLIVFHIASVFSKRTVKQSIH